MVVAAAGVVTLLVGEGKAGYKGSMRVVDGDDTAGLGVVTVVNDEAGAEVETGLEMGRAAGPFPRAVVALWADVVESDREGIALMAYEWKVGCISPVCEMG